MDVAENLDIDYLKKRKVCATGRLVSMTHQELARVVTASGGEFMRTPRRCGFTLVVGDGGWPANDDASISTVFRRASHLKAYGYAIAFISEEEFLDNLGFHSSANAIRGPHTIADLGRILDVSVIQLRKWMRLGLIRAEATQFHIPYFNFHQVAFIKQLVSALRDGATLSAIRSGIEQSKELLPHGDLLFELCSGIDVDGRILVRLRDGLLDHSGQRYFDFESAGEHSSYFAEEVRTGLHDLCDEALALEEEGEIQSAAETYRRALELDPHHPTLLFDLGNVLFQMGELDQSIQQFQNAVKHDPKFAMAWHNLGSVLGQFGNLEQAEAALRRALDLVPDYADSHFLLAEILRRTGRTSEAAQHEAAYKEHSRVDCLLASREHGLRVFQADDEEKRTS